MLPRKCAPKLYAFAYTFALHAVLQTHLHFFANMRVFGRVGVFLLFGKPSPEPPFFLRRR